MKILVKFPSRERPERFLEYLERHHSLSKKPEDVFYLISLDQNDPFLSDYLSGIPKITANSNIIVGESKNKIHAINRDVGKIHGWDILVSSADDMYPTTEGWDEVIRDKFRDHFPELNGCLWFFDGTQKHFCTMAIMGKEAYDSCGYIYHPSYDSLWCDQEFTDYWNEKYLLVKSNQILFLHRHPSGLQNQMKKEKFDALYKRNEQRGLWDKDEANYKLRKSKGFPA